MVLLLLLEDLAFSAKIELSIEHWMVGNGLPDNRVEEVWQDSIGYIWFQGPEGSYRFDGQESIKLDYQHKHLPFNGYIHIKNQQLYVNNTKLEGVFNNHIKATDGKYWATSLNGLGIVDVNTHKFRVVGDQGGLPETECTNLEEGANGKIWFSMHLNSIGFWDPVQEKIFTLKNIKEYHLFKNGYEVFAGLIDRNISSLFIDRAGSLWIATLENGIYKISFEPERFQFFRFDYEKQKGLVHKDISFPLATKSGDVWISTWGGGINIWEKDELELVEPTFVNILVKVEGNIPLPEKRIFPLLEDRELNIWFGTFGGGLYLLENVNRAQKKYQCKAFTVKDGQLLSDTVRSLYADKEDGVWCGTTEGLVYIDNKLKSTTTFSNLKNPDLFKGKEVTMVKMDGFGKLWIGTAQEITFQWDIRTNEVSKYTLADSLRLGTLFNHARVNNIDWFAGNNGLFYYDESTNKFHPFKNNHLLPSSRIESILSDSKGMLWLGTNRGFAKVNPITGQVKIFDLPGGVMGSSFTQGASKDAEGYLYFGSRHGLYRFLPDNLEYEPEVAPIVFSKVSISGKVFGIDSVKRSKYWKRESHTKPGYLNLNYRQNTISLEYTSLNYSSKNQVIYEVMLEGNDHGWEVTTDTRRTWSSLPAGEYIFKVREKGKQNEVSIPVKIPPPWWGTSRAIFLYMLLILIIATLIVRFLTLKAKEEEKKLQKEKYDQLRFKFFLNISHEIRTPLTLIKGSIDRLAEHSGNEGKREIGRLQRNTNRLIRMVNEVLDLKKIEKAEVEVNNSYFNLKDFLESTVDAFRLREEKSRIKLTVPEEPVWINSARDLIETILYNLLSNAVKFSGENEPIEVLLSLGAKNNCTISVRDYGVGIKAEEQPLIFERFYKTSKNSKLGAGIGLSLVKEFAGLLNGSIKLESEYEQGSTFSLVLPLEAPQEKLQASGENQIASGKPALVITDDQPEIRAFIREIFEGNFSCVEAEDGIKAWELIKQHAPQVIISDVMMPGYNGFQLCKKVKSDIETSHIPFVLLTAKTGDEAELDAVKCNADVFISKPFNEKLLKLKVEKLIEQRKLLWQKYLQQSGQNLPHEHLNTLDLEFMGKLEQAIADEIENTEFNVEALAQSVFLSSSGLYRKVKGLTGQSPVEFIRAYRLKKAANLLKSTTLSVSEIADKTGFGTQKYFSRCFKEQFGLPPIKFRNKI